MITIASYIEVGVHGLEVDEGGEDDVEVPDGVREGHHAVQLEEDDAHQVDQAAVLQLSHALSGCLKWNKKSL